MAKRLLLGWVVHFYLALNKDPWNLLLGRFDQYHTMSGNLKINTKLKTIFGQFTVFEFICTLPKVLNLEFLCLALDSGSDNDCLGH